MKKKLFAFRIVLTGIFLQCSLNSSAQQANVSVNNNTGTPSVSIPICTVRSGDLSLPVTLVYSGGGVKVKDVEGTAGIGWYLIAGGEISREVRGLPDDQVKDGSANTRTGWLYNTNGTKVSNFSIANDNNSGTCNDGTADLNYLSNNFEDLSDTEPDIFYVNAPGLNCQLILDKDHNFKTIPYQDIKISYTTNNDNPTYYAYGRITSFTITTDKGTVYSFTDQETTTRTALTSLNPNNIQYFKHEYDQYKNGISYNSAWKLNNITDLGSRTISLTYTNASSRTANSRISLALGADTTMVNPYSIRVQSNQLVINKIYYDNYDGLMFPNDGLKFIYDRVSTSSRAVITAITGKLITAKFNYQTVKTKENGFNTKTFLTSLAFNGLTGVKFDYNGLTATNIQMPDSLSKEVDQWGYYNGSGASSLLPNVYINPSQPNLERYRLQGPGTNLAAYPFVISGAARSVNPSTIINGSLKTITSYYGGTTSLIYEPNDYYDPTSGAVVQGSGIRIKQIIDFDGINTANNGIKNYSYINPSTGLSSGKAISLPLLAFSRPYAGAGTVEEKWKKSTIRLEESVSPESTSIIYTHVKTSQTGAGSTLFEYSAPATFWDASSSPDWAPTVINVAGPACLSYGLMSNLTYAYPFIQNANFDFERGLPKKVTQYNDNNEKLTESTYTYARMVAPTVIQGLRYEYIEGIGSYAKYGVNVATDNLMTVAQSSSFDAPSTIPTLSSTVNSYYQSANHKLLTSQITTNSDGSILKNYIKYIKDYTATTDTNDVSNRSIYNLQLLNVNTPVESYNQVERGGVSKTISGSLIKFKSIVFPYQIKRYVPAQKLSFISNEGLSDFQVSAIGSNTFWSDNRYNVIENDLLYDARGLLLTVDDNNKNVKTIITDYSISKPVAEFTNARADEIAFNDYETDGNYYPGFTYAITQQDSTSSRSGKFSLVVRPSDNFTRTLIKSTTSDYAIFSLWIKSAFPGSVTLSLTNLSGTVFSYSLPYINSSGVYKYYEIKMPVTNMSASFVAKYQSSTLISVDDVLFYPENADVNTTAYNPENYLKTSETNSNGISRYFIYDSNRRLRHVLDQDKNIILKKGYNKDTDGIYYSGSFITSPTASTNIPSSFYADTWADGDGVVYSWNFGDGSPILTTREQGAIYHSYSTPGNYTVTLTKVSPFYGTASSSQVVSVAYTPVNVGVSNTEFNAVTVVNFYVGSALAYSFTGSQLISGVQVTPGVYTIKFGVSGNPYSSSYPNGYRRIYLTLGPSGGIICRASGTEKSIYEFGIDLTGQTSLSIAVDTQTCPVIEAE
jgi:hypothetical protein